jgi:hypothetical protein
METGVGDKQRQGVRVRIRARHANGAAADSPSRRPRAAPCSYAGIGGRRVGLRQTLGYRNLARAVLKASFSSRTLFR